MRIIFSLFLLVAFCGNGRADISLRVSSLPSTVKIVEPHDGIVAEPDAYYPGGIPALRAARGEWESFQIIVTAPKVLLRDVHLETGDFTSAAGDIITRDRWMIFRENFVQIPHPSARFTGGDADNHWWPDALIPQNLQPKISIDPGKSALFWLTIRVPQNAKAGNYSSDITVWANGEKRTLKVLLQVEPFAIPAPSMRANVAVYYDVLRDWYTKNSNAISYQQFAELKKEYYDFLLQYRVNAYDLPVPWNSPEATDYINDPKVLSVRLPPLSQKQNLETAIDVLQKKHALNKGYYYYIDEPPPQRYAEIAETARQLRAINPAIKQCVTIAPNEILQNSVDIWCPNIGDFMGLNHLDMVAMTRQRDAGKETWWYTMVEPKYPYPTWLVDDTALSVRRYGGLMAKYGISGFVYSMAHGWGPQPLQNIASFAGTYGDGTLVYPAELAGGHGPMPSIRLMLLRDAIEDYELMKRNFHISLYPDFHVTGPGKPHYDVAAADKLENYFQMYSTANEEDDAKNFEHVRNLYYDYLAGKSVTSSRTKVRPLAPVAPIISIGKTKHATANSSIQMLRLTADKTFLKVLLQADYLPEFTNDWMAVEIAQTDIVQANSPNIWMDYSTKNSVRWRFIITRKGNAVVEKQSNAGRQIIDDIKWQHKSTFPTELRNSKKQYRAEFDIPRDLFPQLQEPGSLFRFNYLRHYNRPGFAPFTEYGFSETGDIFQMPLAKIER